MIGRVTRFITEKIAEKNKYSFLRKFSLDWLKTDIEYSNLTVVSFSGEQQLSDQLYSIMSFLKNVGMPAKWILFSDGTHSEKSRQLLEAVPFLEFIEPDSSLVPDDYKFEKNPLLKKIFYFQTVVIKNTTIFVDSDVLFYQSFAKFLPVLVRHNWFLVDEGFGYLDESYKLNFGFDIYPCNSGFFVFNNQPQWDVVMGYLEKQKQRKEGIQHWSEQTAFHVLTRNFSEYLPLDPRYFVVGGTDSFSFNFHYDLDSIALRHFVGPIRHKMWQYSWKKLLGI